jgi:hypothetical protein
MTENYIHTTPEQHKFIVWCFNNNKYYDSEKTCILDVLQDGYYLEDGSWRERLNALRERNLNEYSEYKSRISA